MRNSASGFTLIELMIVVAIIGVLASIAIPKFANMVTRAKEAAIKGELGSVRSALNVYYSDTEGQYPYWNGGPPVANSLVPKYMSKIAGFSIPSVSAQSNPGHSSCGDNYIQGSIGCPSGMAWLSSPALLSVFDGAGGIGGCFMYDSVTTPSLGCIDPNGGQVVVVCGHYDSLGNVWTQY